MDFKQLVVVHLTLRNSSLNYAVYILLYVEGSRDFVFE